MMMGAKCLPGFRGAKTEWTAFPKRKPVISDTRRQCLISRVFSQKSQKSPAGIELLNQLNSLNFH